MTLSEYYNFSEDTKIILLYTSFFDEQPDDFPYPSNMSYAYQKQSRFCVKMLDTSNVVNMSYMFSNCNNLTTIPQIDTSNVVNMSYMFEYCNSLILIPQIDTSNVTNMSNMFYLFDGRKTKLKSLPPLDCSKVTNIGNYFSSSSYPRTTLTDVGGWINLKCNWNDGYGLNACPNLTYESCINILNGLYDFVGNNITPTSSQGKLKVHQNFINLVGDEISIATNKGWAVSV